jgi:DNA polymerase-4
VTTRILHLDLDAFFVEVCRQQNPELRDVDLLVVGGRRDQRGVVQSASYGARRFGVVSGMPIARAVRLCPDATFVQGEFRHYRAASKAVRKILREHSPVVVMASLDEAYLDFSGTDRLYPGSLLPVAERIRDAVKRETGLDSSIGVGPNRMIAKIASQMAKPRGLLEVRSGWEEGFMAGLPLRAIPGIGPKTAQRLTGLGLTDVHQIQDLDLEELERLVDRDHAKLLKLRAHGYGGVTLRNSRLPKSVSRETTLSTDMTDRDRLEGRLELLTARVAAALRADALMARTVTLKLRHGDFRTVTRQRTLRVPTDLDREMWEAVRGLFRTAFVEVERRGQGVRLVGVAATGLTPAAPADLFESADRQRQRQLTTAVDRARSKYGFNAVTPGSQLRTRQKAGGDGETATTTSPEQPPSSGPGVRRANRSPSART